MDLNSNDVNAFDKFLIKHNEWKRQRHKRKGQYFSDYDVASGFNIIVAVITFFIFGVKVAFGFIDIALLLWIMNKIDFNKKKKKNIKK